jgi:hypothetical protein
MLNLPVDFSLESLHTGMSSAADLLRTWEDFFMHRSAHGRRKDTYSTVQSTCDLILTDSTDVDSTDLAAAAAAARLLLALSSDVLQHISYTFGTFDCSHVMCKIR